MSLLRPKYWSDEFFATPSRNIRCGFPKHFQPLVANGGWTAAHAAAFSRKDMFELLVMLGDAESQRNIECVQRVCSVLMRLGQMHETELGVLLPIVLSTSAPDAVQRSVCSVLFTPANEHTTAVLLLKVVYEVYDRRQLFSHACQAMRYLHAVRAPATSRLIIYCLITLLRASSVVEMNQLIAGVAGHHYGLLRRAEAKGDIKLGETGGQVHYGLHLLKKCFEVGRMKGGRKGWEEFVEDAGLAAAPVPPPWSTFSAVPCDVLHREMGHPGVTWGARGHVDALPIEEENHALANCSIALSQFDFVEEIGHRFDRKFVEENLKMFPEHVAQHTMSHSQVIPFMDALRSSYGITTDLTLGLLAAATAALANPENATLLSLFELPRVLVAMLKRCCRYFTPEELAEELRGTAEGGGGGGGAPGLALLSSARPGLAHVALLAALVDGATPPAPRGGAAARHVDPTTGVGPPACQPSAPVEGLLDCVIALFKGLITKGGGAGIKAHCLNFHALGFPIYLAHFHHVKALAAVTLLSKIDKVIFTDFFTGCSPPQVTRFVALLEAFPESANAGRLLQVLYADQRARELLPPSLRARHEAAAQAQPAS